MIAFLRRKVNVGRYDPLSPPLLLLGLLGVDDILAGYREILLLFFFRTTATIVYEDECFEGEPSIKKSSELRGDQLIHFFVRSANGRRSADRIALLRSDCPPSAMLVRTTVVVVVSLHTERVSTFTLRWILQRCTSKNRILNPPRQQSLEHQLSGCFAT